MFKRYLQCCIAAMALRMATDCGNDDAFDNAIAVFEMLMDGVPLREVKDSPEYQAMIMFCNDCTGGGKKGVRHEIH